MIIPILFIVQIINPKKFTDPNEPDWSQILSYDDAIENIGFYYNQFQDDENNKLNQTRTKKII